MEPAKQAMSWKIKMASTFLFVKIKWLEVCEKWSGTSEDSILDIFSVSTIFYDELFDSLPIEPANIETTISTLLMETTIAKMIIRKGYVWWCDVWKYVTESGRLT